MIEDEDDLRTRTEDSRILLKMKYTSEFFKENPNIFASMTIIEMAKMLDKYINQRLQEVSEVHIEYDELPSRTVARRIIFKKEEK